jgi:hypothetical protein
MNTEHLMNFFMHAMRSGLQKYTQCEPFPLNKLYHRSYRYRYVQKGKQIENKKVKYCNTGVKQRNGRKQTGNVGHFILDNSEGVIIRPVLGRMSYKIYIYKRIIYTCRV